MAENAARVGEAIWETSNGAIGGKSWNDDYSNFPCSTNPFTVRGGYDGGLSLAGAFAFSYSDGITGWKRVPCCACV